ncbi:MAG: phospholipid-binding protein MlaC [Gammaproteobacteria bacterium]
MRNFLRRFASLALAALVTAAAAAPPATPTQRVRGAIDDVLAVLAEAGTDREERWQRIGQVISRSFDFQTMSQSVLATRWKEATPAERDRFVQFFSQYLEDTYRTRIEGYTGQEIRYANESIKGDKATVDTLIVGGGRQVPVRYRLHRSEGTWYAHDVEIEGVSLVNDYRNTISAIARTEGMDGVIGDLQERIARYRAQKPAAPAPAAGAH